MSNYRKSRKPAREVSTSNLPTKQDGKLDLSRVLVDALTMPGRMSNAYNRFHRYSFLNIALVYMQTGKLEPMGTFNRWKSLGRMVSKGNRALFVNHPKFAPEKDSDGNYVMDPKTNKPRMKVVGFAPKATVFQLHQTDGPELELPELPEWDKTQALETLDIAEVPFATADGNCQGYSVGREFALNPVAMQPFSTMIHELAHIVLGHTADLAAYAAHQGVQEFQAEATALLVCKELGYSKDELGSRAYIQHYMHGDEIIVSDPVVTQIFSAVDTILVAGRKRHYEKMAEREVVSNAA